MGRRRAARTLGQRLRTAAFVLAALVLLGIGALGWLVVVYPAARVQPRGRAVGIEIDEHSTLLGVATQLSAAGLLEQPRTFATFAFVLGASDRLRHGRILVTDSMNARELLQRIATGFGPTIVRITIPEGYNRFDIAARLADWGVCEREEFVQATEDRSLFSDLDPRALTAEGYLFPDTYELRDGSDAREVVKRMLDNTRKRLLRLLDAEAVGFASLKAELGYGLHELVTLASIVEKEAHQRTEQAVIAGVFRNRIRDPSFKPHRLQADPTVAYGCLVMPILPSCAGFDKRRVTRVMTGDPQNPYNTYRLDGLPPGPISNPGSAAMRAVLNPAKHGYFYFVASRDGRHTFSESLQQHNEAVEQHRPK